MLKETVRFSGVGAFPSAACPDALILSWFGFYYLGTVACRNASAPSCSEFLVAVHPWHIAPQEQGARREAATAEMGANPTRKVFEDSCLISV
jgi:hypothetical protein